MNKQTSETILIVILLFVVANWISLIVLLAQVKVIKNYLSNVEYNVSNIQSQLNDIQTVVDSTANYTTYMLPEINDNVVKPLCPWDEWYDPDWLDSYPKEIHNAVLELLKLHNNESTTNS